MAEHVLYGKRRLCYTEVTDFTDFQGIGRDPLYKRFDSVYSVIEKNIEPPYRDFLAHPIYSDEDQIFWYVREWSDMPCSYKDLPESEKAKYAAIKERTMALYEKVRARLSGEDKQILTGALKHLDEDFMFCYDNKVVVVAWGMFPDTHKHVVKGAIIHDLKIQSNHRVRFVVGDNGTLLDKLAGNVIRPDGSILRHIDLPVVVSKKGYAFKGWDPDPLGMKVDRALTFTAIYEEVPIEEEIKENEKVHVSFVANDGGSLSGTTDFDVDKGAYIDNTLLPIAMPDEGYKFVGWDVSTDVPINEDAVFHAIFNRDNVICRFVPGAHGVIEGKDSFSLPYGANFNKDDIPILKVQKGYKFIGWDKSPIDYLLNEDTIFTAQYEQVLPWYKHLWMWITGKGCLRWLLWLLLIILLIWLLLWLLKGCGSDVPVEPIPQIETPSGKVVDDNGAVKDIVGEDGKLPDNNVVAPIVGNDAQDPPIISNPGTPDIIANRLNIYFEKANVNLEQFAADLAQIYSKDECQIIGVDRNIPMIQILIPENMRDAIRENLNGQLSNYAFFIVDESIFTIAGNVSMDTTSVGWHLKAVEVEGGWSITKGDPSIVVAVVDDGIDATHDMLKGRIVSPYNVFTQDNRLSVGQGHGTHVAGLAVGSDKMFGRGISGIAPRCQLMPIQVFDNELCTFSSVTSGIMYAIHNGAHVVNVSVAPNFNGLDVLPIPDQDYIAKTQFKNEERVWKRIIDVANEHNVVIVFAAGNNNILANIPPENRTNLTINVAAVDRKIEGTDFTNYGKGSNISAPGKAIISSVPVNDYAVFDGTSMAAPIVSGLVALMRSCKDVSVVDILHILQATGKQVSGNMPPMIQVDDALIALTTGIIPELPSKGEGDESASSKEGGVSSPVPPVDNNSGNVSSDPDEEKMPPVNDYPNREEPSNGTQPINEEPDGGTDYEAIRKLIEMYKRKISELEKLLPENK